MPRRSFTLSSRHDKILTTLSKKLDITMVDALQRALEVWEREEARREREIG